MKQDSADLLFSLLLFYQIWNHPDIIYKVLKGDKKVGIDNDLDIDDVDATCANKVKKGSKKGENKEDDDIVEDATAIVEEEEDADGFKKPFSACPPPLLPQTSSKFSESDTDSILDLSMLRDADMEMPDLGEKMSTDMDDRGSDGIFFCEDKINMISEDKNKGILSMKDSDIIMDSNKEKISEVKSESKESEMKKVVWSLNGDENSNESKSEIGDSSISKSEVSSELDSKSFNGGEKSGLIMQNIKVEDNKIGLNVPVFGLTPSDVNTSVKKESQVTNIKTEKVEGHSLMDLLSEDSMNENEGMLKCISSSNTVADLKSASCPNICADGETRPSISVLKSGATRAVFGSSATYDEGVKTSGGGEKKMQNVISYDWVCD